MPVIVIDGPEGAGKTTLSAAIVQAWPSHVVRRSWRPVNDWTSYVSILRSDMLSVVRDGPVVREETLFVWDRSWASEAVYGPFFGRVKPEFVRDIENEFEKSEFPQGKRLVKVMLVPPVNVLDARRSDRKAAGEKDDLPIPTEVERRMYIEYAERNAWLIVNDVCNNGELARALIDRTKKRGT